jgi:hypothetical protein
MDQISACSEQGQWRSLVNRAVFPILSNMVEPLPIKTLTSHETKETVGNARRLLQYCQFPDRNLCDILRDMWNFLKHLKFLCIFSTISVGTLVGKH